jgi:hypothetical protein
MPRTSGKTLLKYVDGAITISAGAIFNTIQFFNQFKANASFTPAWSDKPLLKSWQKSKPNLGWPRSTDSLCPDCVREAREKIFKGEEDWQVLVHEKVGEIKAEIIERNGQIWMTKECPIHGQFEDLMAEDSKFLEHIERNFPGRDIQIGRAHV